jgi:metallo-beta-lactamase family protein
MHGEPETQRVLKCALAESDIEAAVPAHGERIQL